MQGVVLDSVLFNVFTNNLVNGIKSMIIRNLHGLPGGERLHVGWKTALELKRVTTF